MVLKLWVLRVLGGCVHLPITTLQALGEQSWTPPQGGQMWLSQVGALPGKDPVPREPLVQHLHQHLIEHLLRLQEVQKLWELGMELESDGAEAAPAGRRSQSPQAWPGRAVPWAGWAAGCDAQLRVSVLGMGREHRRTTAG